MQICGTGLKSVFSAELNQEVCIQCNSKCLTCESSEVCLQCSNDYYLFDNKCSNSCPKDYYGIKAERKCSKCKEGQFEVSPSEDSGICKVCNNNCATCSDREDYCTSCKQKLYAHLGKCETECPKGFYPQDVISKCETCPIECLECKAKDKCFGCRDGFYLYREACLEGCPERTFMVLNEKKCEDCHFSCRNCVGPGLNDCRNDCLESRKFVENSAEDNNNNYNENISTKGRCECKMGHFEEQQPDCGGEKTKIYNI